MKIIKLGALVSLVALAACATQPLESYRPVVDTGRVDAAAFEADLAACRSVALNAEAEYERRETEEMGTNMMAGLMIGAVIGGLSGGKADGFAVGATYGTAMGASATDTELAHGGPRRIIDRCMTDRGYSVLNDLGRG